VSKRADKITSATYAVRVVLDQVVVGAIICGDTAELCMRSLRIILTPQYYSCHGSRGTRKAQDAFLIAVVTFCKRRRMRLSLPKRALKMEDLF
jgi:hypothetical protein